MSANTTIEKDKYFHITNEAKVNDQLFKDTDDYRTFLRYLTEYLKPPVDPTTVKKSFVVDGKVFQGVPHLPKNYHNKIVLVAYSLTNNKFNLLLKETVADNLESFMRSLSTRYSIYFNKKYKRSGSVFNAPYQSIEVQEGEELTLLIHYIHNLGGITSIKQYSQNPEFKKRPLSIKEKETLQQKLSGKPLNFQETSEQVIQNVTKYLKIYQRVPELAFATILFFTLTFLGYKNINSITKPDIKGEVAGAKTENVKTQISVPSVLNIEVDNDNNIKLPKVLKEIDNN